jgi:predicted permease
MTIIRRARRVIRSLFRQPDVESEIEDEMRLHIELEAEELMRNGMLVDEARRQASIAFGGVQQQKEDALEGSRLWWLDGLRRDVRIATRTLLRHPTFAITATLALSLAIAVNTTMFSVLDAMMNPKIGARNPEQLYALRYFGDRGRRLDPVAIDRVLASGGRTYDAYTGFAFTGRGGAVERGAAIRATTAWTIRPNFFAVMGIAPLEGTLAPPADPAAAARLIVISDKLRADMFRDDESPLGQTLDVDGETFTIQGVAARFHGVSGLGVNIWMFPAVGKHVGINMIRLKAGVSREQAEREFAVLAAQLAAAAGESTKETRFALGHIGRQFEIKRFHFALIGAGLAVLLVACTNLANLQLARGIGRASELAVRCALGASRRQVVTQLIIESSVLAAAALVLAVLFAIAGNALVRATIPPNIGVYFVAPASSWRMVMFAGGAAVLSLVLVGLIPAVRVSRVDLNSLIKSRAGTGAHRTNRRTYGALVITQIALTFPLVCAAILLSRDALRVAQPDYWVKEYYGYDPTPLVVATIFRLADTTSARASMMDFAGELISRARGIANVSDAAVVIRSSVPNGTVTVADVDGSIRETTTLNYQIVSPSYFRTMGLPIERGRDFQDGGYTESSVVMDRGSGWYLWPRSSPVGRAIKFGDRKLNSPWMKVQGILGDHLSEDARTTRRSMDTLRVNALYRTVTVGDTFPATPVTLVQLYVRTTRDPQRVASTLRHTLHVTALRTPQVELLPDHLGIPQQILVLRFIAGLFATFGVLALGLSALGVYGIVAQSATDRQREVAVRMSLGASPRSVVHALLREGNVLVLAGVAIGLYMTKETIGWLGSFLGEADLSDALLFGTLCIALFGAMVLSALVPAIRATRLDPMQVLRSE